MKYLLILSFLIFISFNTFSQDHLSITEDLIEVKFNSSLDSKSLEEIKDQLLEIDIEVDYKELKFRKNGKLKSISFHVDCNDGYSGSASAKFSTKNSNVGFYRDYRTDSKNPFGTGTIQKRN